MLRLELAARRPGARPRRRITSVEKENAKFVLRERRGCRGDSQRRRGRSTTQPVCVVQCPLTKNPSKKEKKATQGRAAKG